MNASGPILRDIHLPQVSWWPPALGWWLLAMLVLLVAASVFVAMRYRRRLQPRQAVQRELEALAARHARDGDDAALAAALSRLLRRIALLIEPAAAARDARGWRAFLERRAPDAFDHRQLAILMEAPYCAHATFDGEALLDATRRWCARALRKHVRQPA